jgi:uncharacterized protein
MMYVESIGFTPLKGARHLTRNSADLTMSGPVGDRVFCLVDLSRGRVLRTVENPSLVRACARWESGVLSVDLPGSADLPGETVAGVPASSGELLSLDYWGRAAAVERCEGPWAEAYSDYLGYDVALCRCATEGQVVYGASVTLVTTASLRILSGRLGCEVDSSRFRSTFLVDTGDASAHVEDSWAGRELRIGQATVLVRGAVPRCAVIDLNPVTGRTDVQLLAGLAGYRQGQAGISFGVDAVVTGPGRVRSGDQVVLGGVR